MANKNNPQLGPNGPTPPAKPEKTGPELSDALFEFQTRFKGVSKIRKNTFTQSLYANLDDVMNEAQPLLTELKIAVFYESRILPTPDGSSYITVLVCRLLHLPSNTVMESSLPLPGIEGGAPLLGGFMTYWRRYLFCGMTNIVETDDDDGNATLPVETGPPAITEKQHSEILDFVDATGTIMGPADKEGTLMHHIETSMNVPRIEDLSSRQASTILKMLKNKYKRQSEG